MPKRILIRTFKESFRIVTAFVLVVLSFLPAPLLDQAGLHSGATVAHANPIVTSTKTDTLLVDNDGDNVADPGDTIRYTGIITNSGRLDATNVDLLDVIDANTTLVDLTGNDYRTTPIARHDSYAAIGNVGLTVPAGSGVLANDNDPDGTTPTLTIFSPPTTSAFGGNVVLAGDGSFTYNPAPGFEGTDRFDYTVQDSDGNLDPATVSIYVTDVIWFIDNTAAPGGDGRLNAPFDSLSDHNGNTADDNGDTVFIYSGSYGGGITLQNSQLLVGQGATASLASIVGITTVPPHSNALPSTGGTRPVITNSSGSGITLGSNNLLRGLNVGDTSTLSGAGVRGVSVADLELVEMSLTGQGKALDINGGGTLNVSLDTVSVTNSTNGGVSLQNTGGTTTIGTLSLATTAGTGFLASNAGTVNVNSAGSSTATVNSSGGPGINVGNSTLNATFSGVVVSNSSGIGVRLVSNGGSTNITGMSNTVSTTGGTAVRVSNSTIGGSGITFLSVSASTTDVGIRLNNTGAGDFTVTGSGTTDGSGGTLQNLNDHGIELINAQDVSLSNMNLTNAATTQEVAPNASTCTNLSNGNNLGCNAPVYMRDATNVSLTNLTINGSVQHGVNGNNVNGLSISNTDVSNIGNQNRENGMHFINLLGTVSFSNVSVIGSDTRNVLIENNSGTSNVTVTNSTFNTAGSEVGLDFLGLGTADITFSVTDSSFADNNAPQLKALAEDNSVIDATITGNDFDGNPAVSGNSGVDLAAVDGGTLTFDVIGTVGNPQTFQPFRSHAINVFSSGAGTASGRVNGNTINGSAFGAGIRVVAQVTDFNGTDPSITIEIDNNDISGVQGAGLAGIHIEARDGNNSVTGKATVDATVTNNDVTTTNADAAIQVYLTDLNNGLNRTCINATGNATEANGGAFGETDFFYGNDPVFGTNSGDADMQGFSGSVSNTWFNVNGNTTTTSPSPLALGLGPITGGTCATVAQLSPDDNGAMFAQSDDTLLLAEEGTPTSLAALADPLVEAVAAVDFSAPYGTVLETTRSLATDLASTFQATPAHASGEAIFLSLGDLNPGQIVIITFDVTVDATIPANVTQVCNQGLVTSDNHADLLTDDPTVGDATDPTCTPVDNPTGTIVIVKDTTPAGGIGFGFTDNIAAPNSFTLDDNGTETFTDVPVGTYTVTEDDPTPDFDLIGLSCNDGNSIGHITTRTANINLEADETVTCTFTNRQNARIEVVKVVDVTPNGETFDLIIDGNVEASGIGDGGTTGKVPVSLGSHIVSETGTDLGNYNTGIECMEQSSNSLLAAATGTSIDTGPLFSADDVLCTITNTHKRGSLEVVKNLEPAGDGGTFDLLIDNTPLATGGDGATTGQQSVTVGTHLVSETRNSTDLGNYTVSISCKDNDGTGSDVAATPNGAYGWDVNVNEGDDIVCTITNQRNGTIDIVKQAFPADDTVFSFNSDVNGGGSFFLQDPFDDTETFANLPAGDYTFSEVSIPAGWDLSGIACTEDQTANSTEDEANAQALLTLDPGETVTCTFTNQFNTAPVANDESYSTNEDTALVDATVGPLGDGVLANDTDADGDPLTAALDASPSNGTLTFSGDGSFTYTPNADYCGPDSFTYHANDGLADSNIATVDINVVCVDDPPVVSVDVTTQPVQYSDLINTVTVTASDVDSASLSISHDAPSALSVGSETCLASGTGVSCTWELSGQVLVQAGTYNVTFTVSDVTTGVTAGTEVVVTPEDADAGFDSDNPVAVPVSSPGGDSEPFSLLIQVQESSESGSGVLPGDINEAIVSITLEPVGPGSPLPVSCTSTGSVTAFDYRAVLEVTCDFSGVPVNTYAAAVVVDGGYFSGSDEDVLVVFDPSLGFTTGGGWFYWPGTTDKTNFGYTMKYNKKGQKVKGSLLLIRHLPDGTKYRVKSNAIEGLALGDEGDHGWATFSGKSTYLEPGWPEPVGNHRFVAYVEDHGESGSGTDRVWIEVVDRDGNPVTLSMGQKAADNAELLRGGNVVVPHGGGGKGRGK